MIKTLFISDVHLGSSHAKTKELLDYLTRIKDTPPEKLYLIGDFIDGWKLKRNWHWDNNSNLILRRVLGFLRKGTEIYYIAGNHDEFLREFIEDFNIINFGDINIGNEFVHETIHGEKLLIVHGDIFDLCTKYAKWLAILGDIGYELLLKANGIVNWLRCKVFRLNHWSMSKAIKASVKGAVNYVSDFEKCIISYARERDCNGCICGHIHTPDLKRIGDGFLYCNTGDWVESCSAIIEHDDGRLELLHYHES